MESWHCAGMNYQVYDGVFDGCGKVYPFINWDKHVHSKKYAKDLQHFMDHYDVPPFEAPASAQTSLNKFFQAKYGLFYCYDSDKLYGIVKYDPMLIAYWERNP